jgi:hypothetical protein
MQAPALEQYATLGLDRRRPDEVSIGKRGESEFCKGRLNIRCGDHQDFDWADEVLHQHLSGN